MPRFSSSFSASTRSGAPGFLWRQAAKAGRVRVLLLLGASLLAGGAGVGAALSLAFVLTALLDPAMIYPLSFWYLLSVLGAFLLARLVLTYGADILGQRVSAAVRVHLRHQLYQVVQENGPVYIRSQTTGDWLTLLVHKVEALDGYLARYLGQQATALVVPPVVIGLIALLDGPSALILLGCLLLMPIFLALSGIAAGRASRRQLGALTRLSGQFLDRLRQLTTLRVFGAVKREQAHLAQTAEDFRSRTMAVLRLAFLSAGVLDLFFMMALALIAARVFTIPLPLISQLTAILLVPEFFAPLRALSASYHDRANALNAATDIMPALTAQVTLNEGTRPAPSPLRHPSLELRHVSYTYPGRIEPALKDFSLRVEGTEFVALTGRSGAGKTTIMNLLLGFIEPQGGLIFLAGQPLHQINQVERMGAFSWVGQRAHLFHGTLADNIRLGRPQASVPEILKAAEHAHLGPFIASLPDGLNTLIGERGFGLSGGQAQRVALARAFLRDSAVLLLDEPTAGLDAATSAELMLTIRKLAEGRTVLMITHDPLALEAAERVVTLEAAHA